MVLITFCQLQRFNPSAHERNEMWLGMNLRHQGAAGSLHSEKGGLECGMASGNDGYFFYHARDKYTIVTLQLELRQIPQIKLQA